MNVASYQAKVYQSPPCWELVTDVLLNETGGTVDACRTVSQSLRSIASAFRLELHKGTHGLHQIAEPVDFAVVLMGRTIKLGIHHAGIYYQGKVLHALPDGTLYQDLASLHDEYQLVEYWIK